MGQTSHFACSSQQFISSSVSGFSLKAYTYIPINHFNNNNINNKNNVPWKWGDIVVFWRENVGQERDREREEHDPWEESLHSSLSSLSWVLHFLLSPTSFYSLQRNINDNNKKEGKEKVPKEIFKSFKSESVRERRVWPSMSSEEKRGTKAVRSEDLNHSPTLVSFLISF